MNPDIKRLSQFHNRRNNGDSEKEQQKEKALCVVGGVGRFTFQHSSNGQLLPFMSIAP